MYDSLHGRPLEDARIFAARLHDTAAGDTVVGGDSIVGARTDGAGRYTLGPLAPGRYHLWASVPALDSLGTPAPEAVVDLAGGPTARFDVHLPSARTLLGALCATASDAVGAVFGTVRDARTDSALAGAVVHMSWAADPQREPGARAGDVRTADVRADSGGGFRACGVPRTARVRLRARVPSPERPGDGGAGDGGAEAPGGIEVLVPAEGLVLRDLWVVRARPGRAAEPATLAGLALDSAGAPLPGAYVHVVGDTAHGRGPAMSRTDGRFVLTAVPPGSQTVEVLRMGYAPARFPIDLRPGLTTAVTVRLARTGRLLDTVRVTAIRPRRVDLTALDPTGFLSRQARLAGSGFFITRNDLRLRGEPPLEDVFRTRIRFQIGSDGRVGLRSSSSTSLLRQDAGGSAGDKPAYGVDCPMRIFVDDVPFPGTLREIPAVTVHAVEAYWGPNIPAQYGGTLAGCGVILVWTRNY